MNRRAVVAACRRILDAVDADPRYGHTAHLLVRLGDETVVDERRRGPLVQPVFSVTKSLLATALAALDEQQGLPDLHSPLADVLPDLDGTAARTHTWHQVLSMTRGARTDGPWDEDAVALLPRGQVAHVAAAPAVRRPGTAFAYDNAGAHLLSAAASALLGEPLADFARRSVFGPLGVDLRWPGDPDGISWGFSGAELSAADLGRIGRFWLDGGRHRGRRLLSERFLAAMTTPHTGGGAPEHHPYGYLLWLPPQGYLAGGWAGQHLLVVPRADAVVVVTGESGFELGPPPRDALPPDWRPALELVDRLLLPVLR